MDLIVEAVLVGQPAPFGPNGKPSSIHTRVPVEAPVRFGPDGLHGDRVGDPTVHGDLDKAIHHYARDHYADWAAAVPERAALLERAGAFGENISTRGATEETLCIGDVLRLGSGRVQISQPRQPCSKLNTRFDDPKMAKRVHAARRSGWYYRVIAEGEVRVGDTMTLVERPHPTWTVRRALDVRFADDSVDDDLEALANLTALSGDWRAWATKRLSSRKA